MIGQLNHAIALAFLVVIGGCSEAADDAVRENDATTATEEAEVPIDETGAPVTGSTVAGRNEANVAGPPTTTANSPTIASPAGSAANGKAAQSDAVLAVEGEGLRLFDRQTSAASPIAFGRPAASVLATLERLRGPAGKGTNQDCGAGPVQYANWADGLSLVFQRDRFVGWGLNRRAAGAIGTSSSIGPGSTRAQLDDAYGDVRFSRSSIGQEFSVAGISGLIEGASGDAKITDMWAGISCVAR